MMRIVRKSKVNIDGREVVLERSKRGPFMTESTIFDGGRSRKLVIELRGFDFIIRYARSTRVLAHVGYDEIVKRERAKNWKVGPRK